MSCEKAREYVQQALDEGNVDIGDVGKEQLDQAIKTCCDDVTSQACANAIATLTATGACAAYTEGACVPCCEVFGSVAGPILGWGIGATVSVLASAWNEVSDFISGLFGGGCDSCSYTPAGSGLVFAHSRASEQLAQSLGEAYIEARMKMMGADYLDGEWPIVRLDAGGKYVTTSKKDPGKQRWDDAFVSPLVQGNPWRAWTYVLMWNASKLSEASNDPKYPNGSHWDYKGSRMTLPAIGGGRHSPEEYFYFRWNNWPCCDEGPEEWRKAAEHAMRIRWQFVWDASTALLEQMMAQTVEEIQKEKLVQGVTVMAKRIGIARRADEQKAEARRRTWWWVLGLGVAAAGGYGIYRYTRET